MESFIKNPYSYIGCIVYTTEIINLVSEALNISIEAIQKDTNKREVVEARLIIYYELYKKGIPISDIPEITKIPRDRSLVSNSIKSWDSKVKYDSIFREKVEKVNKYFKKLNINEQYKISTIKQQNKYYSYC